VSGEEEEGNEVFLFQPIITAGLNEQQMVLFVLPD
jgi:hypothetical protein